MVEPVMIISIVTLVVSLLTPITTMIGRIKKSQCGACQVDIDRSPSVERNISEPKENK